MKDIAATFEATHTRSLADAIIEEAEHGEASLTAARWTSASWSRWR